MEILMLVVLPTKIHKFISHYLWVDLNLRFWELKEVSKKKKTSSSFSNKIHFSRNNLNISSEKYGS